MLRLSDSAPGPSLSSLPPAETLSGEVARLDHDRVEKAGKARLPSSKGLPTHRAHLLYGKDSLGRDCLRHLQRVRKNWDPPLPPVRVQARADFNRRGPLLRRLDQASLAKGTCSQRIVPRCKGRVPKRVNRTAGP